MNLMTFAYVITISIILLGRVTAWSTAITAVVYSFMLLCKGAKQVHQWLHSGYHGQHCSGEIIGLVFGYKVETIQSPKPCTKNTLDWDIWCG